MDQRSLKIGAAAVGVGVSLYATYQIAKKLYNRPTCARAPRCYPILGHVPRYVTEHDTQLDGMLDDFKQTGSGTIYLEIPLMPWMIVTVDPKNIEHILRTNFENYPKGPRFQHIMNDLLGDGIFNADGESWFKQRKGASPMFSHHMIRDFMHEVFDTHGDDVVNILEEAREKGEEVDLFNIFNRFTLDCVGEIGFGQKIGCLENPDHPFLKAFDTAQFMIEKRLVNPLWPLKKALFHPDERALAGAVKQMDDFAFDLVRRRRVEVMENAAAGLYDDDIMLQMVRRATGKGTAPNSALGSRAVSRQASVASRQESAQNASVPVAAARALAAAAGSKLAPPVSAAQEQRDKFVKSPSPSYVWEPSAERKTEVKRDFLSLFILADPEATDKMLRDVCTSFLIAGRDTTAQALAWCMWELMQNPGVVAKILAELDGVAAEGRPLAFDQLRNETPYLTAVLHEAIRLHPPVPRDMKQAVKDDHLPDGTFVAAGSLVVYAPYAMGRLAEQWGADCATFRPERWLELKQKPSSYQYAVFQGGPRECLGRHMAMQEMKVVLAKILRRFRFSPTRDLSKVTYVEAVTHGMTPGLFTKVAAAGTRSQAAHHGAVRGS